MINKKLSIHNLLSVLKELYGKLSVLLREMRIASYHYLVNTNNTFDIVSVLNRQIDGYSVQDKKEHSENILPKDKEILSRVTVDNSEIKAGNESSDRPQIKVESEFEKHLKNKKPSSITEPRMGETLKASVWEHVHTAIRYIKKGEIEKAKLHTNIAGHALEEAGHFMSDADYADMVYEVEHYFAESKKQ